MVELTELVDPLIDFIDDFFNGVSENKRVEFNSSDGLCAVTFTLMWGHGNDHNDLPNEIIENFYSSLSHIAISDAYVNFVVNEQQRAKFFIVTLLMPYFEPFLDFELFKRNIRIGWYGVLDKHSDIDFTLVRADFSLSGNEFISVNNYDLYEGIENIFDLHMDHVNEFIANDKSKLMPCIFTYRCYDKPLTSSDQ